MQNDGPSTPIRQRPVSGRQSYSQSHLTTAAAATLASASSIPPPLLSRSSAKASATQGQDEKSGPSLHIHLDESSQQIRLSPSPSRPRSVLSNATDEGLEGSLIIDSSPRLEEEGQTTELSRGKADTAVRTAFLARRLRSAIGDELVLRNEVSSAAANGSSDGTIITTSRPVEAVSAIAFSISGANDSEQSRVANNATWNWSTLTNLPASLRSGLDQSIVKTASASSADPTPQRDYKIDQEQKSETNSFGSYMKPLDVRRWWSNTSARDTSSEKQASSSRQSSVRTIDESRSTKSHDSPKKDTDRDFLGHPRQGVSSGSFPASSIAKRNKKKREQLLKQAKERDKTIEAGEDDAAGVTKGIAGAEGSDITVHDLSYHPFGVTESTSLTYPEREYLVLSTAGKPIFISHVSKARLKRAAETKTRQEQRHQQETVECKEEEEEELLAAKDSALQDEEDQNAATRVGVIQALISNYESLGHNELQQRSKDILQLPDNSRISFVLKPPLYLAAISQWGEDEATLCNHLEYLYYAIISIVSVSKLNRLFDRAANFDLKRLLDGTDGILDSLLTNLQLKAAPLYDSLQPLRIEASLRAEAAAALVPSKDQVRPRDALYALLVGSSGIVALAKRKRKSIHPVDCHLLLNTVYATKSMKEAGTQSWVPICLPKFAPQGFLYAHVSFLREEIVQQEERSSNDADDRTSKTPSAELALVLVTSNPDGFEELSLWQHSIVETLQTQQILVKLLKAMQISSASYTADELRLPGLRHFIFKWRSNLQATSPQFEDPYELDSGDQKRLICLYGIAQEYVYRRATSSDASKAGVPSEMDAAKTKDADFEQKEQLDQGNEDKITSPPSPILRPKNVLTSSIDTPIKAKKPTTTTPLALPLAPKRKPIILGQHLIKTSFEIVFAWSTSQFELYLAVGLHLPHNAIINIAKAIVRWVKQEEHRLFIASPSIFD